MRINKRFVNRVVLTIILLILVGFGLMTYFLINNKPSPEPEDAVLRIMSYNLLVDNEDYNWGTPLGDRPNGAAEYILRIRPDVIGIQEASRGWYSAFRELLKGEYDFVEPDFAGIKDGNCTGLMYDVKKVRLIASEQIIYSVSNNERMRLVDVGVFERISDGKRFAVSSTHLDSEYPGDRTAERLVQINELIEIAKRYVSEYGCPYISTGDMNITPDKPEYRALTENGVFFDADQAPQAHIVDHIFHTEGVEPLCVTLGDDETVKGSSDHLPLFADFTLK